MATLTGKKPAFTYKDILQVSNSNTGIDSTLREVTDGEGTSCPLELSTTQVRINGIKYPTSDGTVNQVIKTDGAGNLSFGTVSGGASALDDLTDVTITGVASNNVLQYNGAAWVNLSLAGAGISAVGHTHVAANITDLATAAVAFSNKTGNISQWTNDSNYITVAGVPVPTTITVANEATDTTCYIAFFTATTGNLGPKTNANLSFNSNTGVLTASAGIIANLTGNVTGNTSGSSGSCTGNAATATLASTVTTNANLTGPITSVGNATSIASQTGTGSKFVVDNGPTLITPILGVATATSINKVALTAPATGSTLTIADGQTLTVNGSATITNGTHSGTNTGDQLVFKTISVSGQSDVVADTATDTLTLAAGSNVTITTNATTDTITIAASGSGGVGDADYGDVTVSGGGTVFTVDSVTVADAAADTTTWPMLSRNVTGSNQVVSTDPGLTYDASANSLATTTFVGALTGNATTATTLATPRAIGGVNFDGSAAITPANITIANEGTDTTCFPLFTTAATGDLPPKSNASLTYNSNTGALGSTSFVGALTGNVTGNVTGSSGSCTGNAATVTTNANLTGEVTSTGNAAVVDKTAITNRSADATPDPAADYVMTYDASAAALKKVLLQYLGGYVYISTQTASASSTIDFTGLSTMYRDFKVVFSHVVPGTNNSDLWLRTSTDNGSTYDSGASAYQHCRDAISTGADSTLAGSTGDTKIVLGAIHGTGTRESFSGEVILHSPQEAKEGHIAWNMRGKVNGGTFYNIIGSGIRDTAADIDAIRFLYSSGNIASGIFTLYGLPK